MVPWHYIATFTRTFWFFGLYLQHTPHFYTSPRHHLYTSPVNLSFNLANVITIPKCPPPAPQCTLFRTISIPFCGSKICSVFFVPSTVSQSISNILSVINSADRRHISTFSALLDIYVYIFADLALTWPVPNLPSVMLCYQDNAQVVNVLWPRLTCCIGSRLDYTVFWRQHRHFLFAFRQSRWRCPNFPHTQIEDGWKWSMVWRWHAVYLLFLRDQRTFQILAHFHVPNPPCPGCLYRPIDFQGMRISVRALVSRHH